MLPIPAAIEKLLIICPSWVGDTIMATPVYRAARLRFPDARIACVTRSGLEQLLEGSTWFDECIVGSMKGFGGPFSIARRIGQFDPQAVLLLPNSFRSALIARLSRVPLRIGYARDGRGMLLTDAIASEKSKQPISTVHYYANLARRAFDLETIDFQLELHSTPHERSAAIDLLSGIEQPFVLLNPGANKAAKRWPADRFATVADALAESNCLAVAVTGSPGESSLAAEISDASATPIVNLIERGITLGTLKAVIEQAAIVITNDTGPRHIAAALGTPVVTLFGPTDYRWALTGFQREKIILAEPFLLETLIADKHAKVCAIERISAGDVIATAQELLA